MHTRARRRNLTNYVRFTFQPFQILFLHFLLIRIFCLFFDVKVVSDWPKTLTKFLFFFLSVCVQPKGELFRRMRNRRFTMQTGLYCPIFIFLCDSAFIFDGEKVLEEEFRHCCNFNIRTTKLIGMTSF